MFFLNVQLPLFKKFTDFKKREFTKTCDKRSEPHYVRPRGVQFDISISRQTHRLRNLAKKLMKAEWPRSQPALSAACLGTFPREKKTQGLQCVTLTEFSLVADGWQNRWIDLKKWRRMKKWTYMETKLGYLVE